MTDILETAQESVAKAQAYLTRAKAAVGQCAMRDGKLDGAEKRWTRRREEYCLGESDCDDGSTKP